MIHLVNGAYTKVAQDILADLTLNGGAIVYTSVVWSSSVDGTNPCLLGSVLYKKVNGNVVSLQTSSSNRTTTITSGSNDRPQFFLLYAQYVSESPSGYNVTTPELFYKSEVADPVIITPYDSSHEDSTLITIDLTLHLNVTTSQASSITVNLQGDVSREEFYSLKNRVVTAHSEGNTSLGEDQLILGDKTFDGVVSVYGQVDILDSNDTVVATIGEKISTTTGFQLGKGGNSYDLQVVYESDNPVALNLTFNNTTSIVSYSQDGIVVHTDLVPSSANGCSLGSLDQYFSEVYAGQINLVSGNGSIGFSVYQGGIDCSADFNPSSDLSLSLGTAGYSWLTVYASHYYGSGDMPAFFHGVADKANQLSSNSYINGVVFNGTGDVAYHALCSTAAGTTVKTVDLPNFKYTEGAVISVRFTNGNTVSSPSLSINGSTAVPIFYGYTNAGSTQFTSWGAGTTLILLAVNNRWYIVGNRSIGPGMDAYGDAIHKKYVTKFTGNSNMVNSYNRYIGLQTVTNAVSRMYISDIIANSLAGFGGIGFGNSEGTNGYTPYSVYGSVGTLGLFRIELSASDSAITAGSTVSGSSLKRVAFYSLKSDDAPCNFYFFGDVESGTWRILNPTVSKSSSASTYCIVLAVRIL